MRQTLLECEVRDALGTGAARRLRNSGAVPAVVYGKGVKNFAVAVDEAILGRLLREGVSGKLIQLRVKDGRGAQEKTVVVKEIQRDPIKGNVIHVDFQEVSLTEEISTTVPVVLVGEDRRKNDGGILEHLLWSLDIRALPTAIPERVEVDVSGLGIGDTIHVKDLVLPEGVKAITPPDEMVVSILAPTKAEEEAPAAAETPEEGAAGTGAEEK